LGDACGIDTRSLGEDGLPLIGLFIKVPIPHKAKGLDSQPEALSTYGIKCILLEAM
jgi:hypothetical protein